MCRRPTGVPACDVAAHLIEPHMKCVDKLKSTLKEEEERFEVLKRRVAERRLALTNKLQIVKERNAILKQVCTFKNILLTLLLLLHCC